MFDVKTTVALFSTSVILFSSREEDITHLLFLLVTPKVRSEQSFDRPTAAAKKTCSQSDQIQYIAHMWALLRKKRMQPTQCFQSAVEVLGAA